MERLTEDHTVSRCLVELGEITPEMLQTHPDRHRLTRFLGMREEAHADVRLCSLLPGDVLLLCSDGLTGMLSETTIREILTAASDTPEGCCAALVGAANQAGGTGNVTALVIIANGDRMGGEAVR